MQLDLGIERREQQVAWLFAAPCISRRTNIIPRNAAPVYQRWSACSVDLNMRWHCIIIYKVNQKIRHCNIS